ncbi:MAG TPA: hypothetical protein VFY13_04860 [Luteolibacter sp.]|nr:hypothetical protein [Luteolibacter sp.]
MKRILMFLFAALLAVGNGSAPACEPEAQPIQNDALWQGNRLTPDQPFPARVIGVAASWVGYQLLLEELDAESPRYCYVHVAATGALRYRQASKEQALQLAHWEEETTPLPVSEFSIDNKLHQLGERFGANDLLRRAAAMTAREKQAQAQVAAGSDVAGKAYDSVRIVSAESKEIARSADPATIALLLASMKRAQPAGSNTQGLSLTSILSLSSPESRRPAEGATPVPREVSSWYIDLQSGHFAPVSPPKLAIQRFTEADFAQLKEKLKIPAAMREHAP